MTKAHSPRRLGEMIRDRRQELGLTQVAAAEAAGVSRKWLVDIEAGKPSAEIGLVLRLLDVLDIDLDVVPRERSANRLHDWPGSTTVDLDDLLRGLKRR